MKINDFVGWIYLFIFWFNNILCSWYLRKLFVLIDRFENVNQAKYAISIADWNEFNKIVQEMEERKLKR